MGADNFAAIKKKPFILGTGLINNQYNDTINDIINETKLVDIKNKWDLTWGQSYLYCHDYVWNYDDYDS